MQGGERTNIRALQSTSEDFRNVAKEKPGFASDEQRSQRRYQVLPPLSAVAIKPKVLSSPVRGIHSLTAADGIAENKR